jgi:hypothetical protein
MTLWAHKRERRVSAGCELEFVLPNIAALSVQWAHFSQLCVCDWIARVNAAQELKGAAGKCGRQTGRCEGNRTCEQASCTNV